MKEKTLVVLAAGMGSRFKGLKQIEPVGPNNEFIIDYSVYDAIENGFNKVVFIIKKENYNRFKETIGNRIKNKIKIDYVFQENNIEQFKNREKPLGTAHAILCTKDIINGPFMIINADDYYGKDAFKKGASLLNKKNYGLISYKIKNTITENGKVKRGVCRVEDGFLKEIVESEVEKENNKIKVTPLDKKIKSYYAKENTEVSMNMLIFDTSIFEYLEKELIRFTEDNKENTESCEFLLPDVLLKAIKNNYAKCEVIKTDSNWYGMTYKEDLKDVKKAIKQFITQNKYPKNLWN